MLSQGEAAKEIGKGVALAGLIFSLSVLIPVFGFFFTILMPLPTLFYRIRLGRYSGAFVPVISGLIIILLLGRVSFDLLFFAEMLLLGFAMAEAMEMQLSVENTILSASGVVLGTGGILMIVYGNLTGTDLPTLISAYIGKNLEMSLMLYKEMGVSPENIQAIEDTLDTVQYVLVRVLPGMAAAATLFLSWVTLLMARHLLKKRGLFFPRYATLNQWKPPEALVWAVIGCGLLLILPDRPVRMIGLNGLMILMTIYFFGGIAIISYFFEKKRLPVAFRFFVYSLIALQQFFWLVVIGLGFFDIWLNFRKIENKSE